MEALHNQGTNKIFFETKQKTFLKVLSLVENPTCTIVIYF